MREQGKKSQLKPRDRAGRRGLPRTPGPHVHLSRAIAASDDDDDDDEEEP